jgi:hypothetical protein
MALMFSVHEEKSARWPSLEAHISRRLPFTNVVWDAAKGGGKAIPKLAIEFVPFHQTAQASVKRDPPLFEVGLPFLHVLVLSCDVRPLKRKHD